MAALRSFCIQMKANLWKLKSLYGLEFLVENIPEEELISHVIFTKLPSFFKRELIRLAESNYPRISFILENVSDTRTLECTRYESVDRKKTLVKKVVHPPRRSGKSRL